MSEHDDGARPWTRRRKQVATATVGLTALLGVGAYVITAQVVGGHQTTTPETAAQAQPVGQGKGEANPEPRPTPSQSMTVDERIKAARSAAAKDSHPVQHALTQAPGIQAASDVVERNKKVENGSLRVITARSDLSGQRELMWAADKGKRYGHAMCTKNFKFANNQTPAIRPTMLLCWRASAKRSVATVLVDYGGHPSWAKSAAIIDREWAKLG
jgi:hypothetical protein